MKSWHHKNLLSKVSFCDATPDPKFFEIFYFSKTLSKFFFGSLRIFFLLFNTLKKLNKCCFLDKMFLFLKKSFVSLKILLKFCEVRSERGDFNWCWFWTQKMFLKILEISNPPTPHFFSDWLFLLSWNLKSLNRSCAGRCLQ